jgi:hypothetical protein
MTYKLLKKTHLITGLKYLCITKRDDYDIYKGSGVYWRNHLKKYGSDIETELLYETDSLEDLERISLDYSALWDIVESDEWANLIPESGYHIADPERHRAGWLGWYESLSDEERETRNRNISKKVSQRLEKISDTLPQILSERRKALPLEKREARKKKIQAVYKSGKHDCLFERYSKERVGSGNPAAKEIEIDGVRYGSVQEASRATGIPAWKLYRLRKTKEDYNENNQD